MKQSVRKLSKALAYSAALIALTVSAADRDALRHIVQDQCLVHWSQAHDPAPCVRVVQSNALQGYAVLPDRKGGAHFLLIPTQTITGMEDARLLRPDTANYFAAAWQARDQLANVAGHPLRRDAIGLAINSARARGQDQLHIHIECLQPPLYHALQTAAASLGDHWAPWRFEDSPYMALRIRAQDLAAANPIELLANSLPGARQSMGDYTILVAGAQFKDGPGFIVLTGRTPTRAALLNAPVAGLVAPGETLLDATCAIDP
jgi:CDP-diacylglycerol pyrophosphatase